MPLLSFDNPDGAWQSTRLIRGRLPRDTGFIGVFGRLGPGHPIGLPEEWAW